MAPLAGGAAARSLAFIAVLLAYTCHASRVDLSDVITGIIVDGSPDAAQQGRQAAPTVREPVFKWQSILLRKPARRFALDEERLVEAHGSCRLHVYHPPPPSMTATLLCNGRDDPECMEPCIEGYTRRSKGLCHQHCPATFGPTVPSARCPGVMVCIRPSLQCPHKTEDVSYWCPSPEALVESCAKHEYVAPVTTRPKDAPCKGALYKDFLGRWQCSEPEWREPCRAGYNQTSPNGTCTQACPPWLVDCGLFCASPKAGCSALPRDLCPLGALNGCGIADRTESMLATACAAEGHRTTATCPLSLTLHGGCGGSRLMLASGLRAQGNVVRIEAWWEGGKPLPAAAAGTTADKRADKQQQQQQQPGSDGTEQASSQQQQHHWRRDQQQRELMQGPPVINYLPHAQMPAFHEPTETVLVAVRITFARGLSQVLGNETAASQTSPRSSYAFTDGEAIRRLTIWSSEHALDGAALTPLVGGFSFTTSAKGSFLAGEPPTALPAAAVAAAAAAEGSGSESIGAGASDMAGGRVGDGGKMGVLDVAVVGGSNVTLSGGELGTGLLVGASAFTSGSALNALGLVFLKGGPDKTEL